MTTTNQWDIFDFFTQDDKEWRAKSCSCKDIIYNDVEKWFMDDLAFKSIYYSCKEQPDLPKNKITKDSTIKNNNFFRIVSKILTGASEFFPKTREWYNIPCKFAIDIYYVTKRDFENGFDPDKLTPEEREGYYLYTETCDKTPGTNYLVNCSIMTFLFNTITSKEFIGYTKDMMRFFPNFEKALRNKLIELKQEKIYTSKWVGANYYYKKLFLKPIYFDDMEIPSEILHFRKSTYFNDMICGHPKASHGWCVESLQELIDLNLINV